MNLSVGYPFKVTGSFRQVSGSKKKLKTVANFMIFMTQISACLERFFSLSGADTRFSLSKQFFHNFSFVTTFYHHPLKIQKFNKIKPFE